MGHRNAIMVSVGNMSVPFGSTPGYKEDTFVKLQEISVKCPIRLVSLQPLWKHLAEGERYRNNTRYKLNS